MKTFYFWPLSLLFVTGALLCSQVSRSPALVPSDGREAPVASVLNKKAKHFLAAEQYDSAAIYARAGVRAAENSKDWNTWGAVQLNLLTANYYLERNAESIGALPDIERSAQSNISADSSFWGVYFNLAGAIFNEVGNYEEALRYGLKEIAFYEKKEDSLAQALACNNVGTYYRSRGDYDRALEYTQSALQIYKFASDADPADLSWTYSNLSAIWYRKKDYPQAAATAREALAILEKHFPGDKPHDLIVIYNDLANACVEMQEHDQALAYIQKALSIHRQSKVDEDIEVTWHNLGYIYRMMGKYPEAVRYLKKAIGQYGPSHPNLGKAYRHLGFIALRQGDLRGALSWQQQALRTLTDSFPYQDMLANPAVQRVNAYQDFLFTLRDKGETLQRLAEKESNPRFLEASLATYEIAAGLLDSMRSEYQEGSRQFWNQEARPIVENGIGVAMRLYFDSKEVRYLEKAFGFAERNKALLLAEALRDAAAHRQAGIPDSILHQEKSLKIDIAFYKRQIFREQQKTSPDTSRILLWQKNILARRRANEALLKRLENFYPEYYQIKYSAAPLTISDLRQRLPADAGLLQYFRGEKKIYVFYFDRTSARGQELPADSRLTAPLGRFLDVLHDRDQASEQGRNPAAVARFAADADTLYRALLAPVVEKMPEKLLVVPDGDLAYLPFELLNTARSTETTYAGLPFLLRQTTLRYEYSASLALQQHPQPRARQFFAGYAPAYDQNAPVSSRGGATNCSDADAVKFGALRNNQTEVKQIAQLLGGQAFTGAEATETAFKQHAQEARILHLATHGFLNDCDPLYSGLVFQRPDNNNSASDDTDGFLHTYEIYNLRLNADLAVLSACNTGRGQLAKGEGVISLARAFRYAGCPNVIMSLWQADDQATAQIMQDFYRYLQQGMGKDAAIRQARLNYLDTQPRNHPFYWGAFVLVGDGEPVEQGSSHRIWYAILLLAGGLLFRYWRKRAVKRV